MISKWLKVAALAALPALALPSSALAGEKEAKTCLNTKIWDGYNDGWAVRTAVDATLKQGEHRVYLVTLYAGNQYQVKACGDASAANIDLVLHDKDGKEVARDKSEDSEPGLSFTPQATGTYYVALYAAALKEQATEAGVARAVTYK
jgi:hypothetical protein